MTTRYIDNTLVSETLRSYPSSFYERLHFLLIDLRKINGKNPIIQGETESGVDFFARLISTIFEEQYGISYFDDFCGKSNFINELQKAYDIAKQYHKGQRRESNERVFDHLIRVTYIYLLEVPNPTFEGILTSLFHDSKEDTNIVASVFLNMFGKESGYRLNRSVDSLTKPDIRDFVTDEEKKQLGLYHRFFSKIDDVYEGKVIEQNYSKTEDEFKKYVIRKLGKDNGEIYINKLKQKRNKIYFGSFSKKDIEDFIVKCCDRVHNLRTEKYSTSDKAQRKYAETCEYFIPALNFFIEHYTKNQEILGEDNCLILERLESVKRLIMIELIKLTECSRKSELDEILNATKIKSKGDRSAYIIEGAKPGPKIISGEIKMIDDPIGKILESGSYYKRSDYDEKSNDVTKKR